jgi:hypothetical protein
VNFTYNIRKGNVQVKGKIRFSVPVVRHQQGDTAAR